MIATKIDKVTISPPSTNFMIIILRLKSVLKRFLIRLYISLSCSFLNGYQNHLLNQEYDWSTV